MHRRMLLLSSLVLGALGTTTLLSPDAARADDGLTLRVLYGPADEDVTHLVDWFGTTVGLVTGERFLSGTDRMIGFDYAERIRGFEASFPSIDGDLGVELSIGGSNIMFRQPVTGEMTELVLRLDDYARVMLVSEALQDDDYVSANLTNSSRITGTSTIWEEAKGPYFLEPDTYSVSVEAVDKGVRMTTRFTVSAQDDVTITLAQD